MTPNYSNILCYLDISSLPEHAPGERSSLVRELIDEAIAAGIDPATPPFSSARQAIPFSADQVAELKRLSEKHGLAPGRVAGGLAIAIVRARARNEATLAPVLDGLGSHQAQALKDMAPHLKKGRIVLAEYGTGSGKSRIICHAAAFILSLRDAGHEFPAVELPKVERAVEELFGVEHHALPTAEKALARISAIAEQDGPPRTVYIAAPTVANISHLINEYRLVSEHIDPNKRWKIGVALGRRQFVDPLALDDLLESTDAELIPPKLVRWVKAGMPAGKTRNTTSLKKLIPEICGLMDDLLAVAGDLPNLDSVALDASSTEDCGSCYFDVKAALDECDIVFTSHAMLSIDSRLLVRESEFLPRPLALLVDEGHLAEYSVATLSATNLTLNRLKMLIGNADFKGAAAKQAEAVITAIASAEKRIEGTRMQRINLPYREQMTLRKKRGDRAMTAEVFAGVSTALVGISKALGDLRSSVAKTRAQQSPDTRRCLAYATLAARALGQAVGNTASGSIEISKTRRAVTLSIGPRDVRATLLTRWMTTPVVALFSGTLMYRGANGPQIGPVIHEFALPPERTVMVPPHTANWVFESPTIHIPSVENFERFLPPDDAYDEDELLQWGKRVAGIISDQVAPSAKGGTMVLMSGYDRATAVAEACKKLGIEDRLVLQKRAGGIVAAEHEFRERYAAGEKPIWLATGGAWTGLDLFDRDIESDREVPADEDFLLTDLVIPNMPFGLNKSPSHAYRVERAGFMVERFSAQQMFRQGLGRLMRRKGLSDRRIWLLDGRLYHPAKVKYMADFWRVIEQYANIQQIGSA